MKKMKLEHNKLDLVALRERKMEGVLLRSRARWIAKGKKITKYFFVNLKSVIMLVNS